MLILVSRSLLLRDRWSGNMGRWLNAFSFATERFFLMSGGRELSAVYISAGEDAPAFVICHGIGERVEYWGPVQSLLRQEGVSSLVFNYTGFGASAGLACAAYCEDDAVAAVEELARRGTRNIFLLGFSMGTGVASAIVSRVKVRGVILCQGFSSLREAAQVAGIPRWVTLLATDTWRTEEKVRGLEVPVLVVHSEDDGLFPVAMAERVALACGERGEKIVLSGFPHNTPIFAAPEVYWRPIAEWAKSVISGRARREFPVGSLDAE
jgi:alpha-beta hydrolase superfamily lysophospholipase